MQLLIYVLVYPILWLISRLPFPIFYAFSDLVYILVYRIIGYRKKTVRRNLELAFPDYSPARRHEIEKKSYRHLCDMFLEMIKTMGISHEEINKRFMFTNLDMVHQAEAEGKSIAIMAGHYGSYEWVISMNGRVSFRGFAIYKKIANEYFDRLIHRIRSKFGAALITTKETIPTIEANERAGIRGIYGFAADQSPKASKIYHWGMFMGIESPIITGAEMLAKKYDMNILFLRVRKVGRGYYQATFERPFPDVRSVPDYQISDTFMQMVEEQVREAPEYYLWTHKRWKVSREQTTSPHSA